MFHGHVTTKIQSHTVKNAVTNHLYTMNSLHQVFKSILTSAKT